MQNQFSELAGKFSVFLGKSCGVFYLAAIVLYAIQLLANFFARRQIMNMTSAMRILMLT